MISFTKIAHRGASGYEPENTMTAFQKAIDLNADMIELDVHICKSGELVVIHDEKINRTTNGTGRISSMDLNALKKFDAGSGNFIPTLMEVLQIFIKKIKINIELKGLKTARPLLDELKILFVGNNLFYDNLLISSSNYSELLQIKMNRQKIKIGLLAKTLTNNVLAKAKELNAFSIHLPKESVGLKTVNLAHQNNLQLYVYTANEISDINKIKLLGADGIFSDYPDRL